VADAPATPTTLAEQLKSALSESEPDQAPSEQAVQFYDRVMERLKNLITSLRRSIFELVLIAAVIQLLDLTVIAGFQVGPIELRDLRLVHQFLPVVAAYLIYDIVATVIRYTYANGIAAAFDRAYRPKLYEEPYYGQIYPPAPNILVPIPPFTQQTAILRLIKGFNILFRIVFALAPFVLIAYWYVRLFLKSGFQDVFVYISAVLSICLLAYAVLFYWQARKDGMVMNIVKI
jgi:hypothetical protein